MWLTLYAFNNHFIQIFSFFFLEHSTISAGNARNSIATSQSRSGSSWTSSTCSFNKHLQSNAKPLECLQFQNRVRSSRYYSENKGGTVQQCSFVFVSLYSTILMVDSQVDVETAKVLALMVEKQKYYSSCAEQFSKVRQISQQLSRCNTLLNQNIESMDMLNNMLSIDERLEPFVWKTTK